LRALARRMKPTREIAAQMPLLEWETEGGESWCAGLDRRR